MFVPVQDLIRRSRGRVSDPSSRFERLTSKSPRLCRGMFYSWKPTPSN